MKASLIALALAISATTASAYASAPVSPSPQSVDAQQALQSLPAQANAAGKTRAEVRQELVQAQKDGQLAALSKLYQGS